MQNLIRLSKPFVCLTVIFFHLISLPGSIEARSPKRVDFSPVMEQTSPPAFCTAEAQSTGAVLKIRYISAPEMESLIASAVTLTEDELASPENSFFRGFVNAIQERYPFKGNAPKALLNVGKDALIVVVGAGVAIGLVGATAFLSTAGMAAAGTILVTLTIAGAAVGIAVEVGSIVKNLLKGSKEEAGREAFNFLRIGALSLGGGAAGLAVSGGTSLAATRFAESLESRAPQALNWLKSGLEPTCQRVTTYVAEQGRLGIVASGGSAIARDPLISYVESGSFKPVKISRVYTNGRFQKTIEQGEDPRIARLLYDSGEEEMCGPAKDVISFVEETLGYKPVEINTTLENPNGKSILWKKSADGDEYIRIAGGKFTETESSVVLSEESTFSEVHLLPDGSIKKITMSSQNSGVYSGGNSSHEANMIRAWGEANPGSQLKLLEEGPGFIRTTFVKGTPLEEIGVGELELNPGAFERFVTSLENFNERGFIYDDFVASLKPFKPHNIIVNNGELDLIDFNVARPAQPRDFDEIVREMLWYLQEHLHSTLKVKNVPAPDPALKPVEE